MLNFADELTESDPNISWERISTLTAERYADINRQKDVSDWLNKLRFADFTTPGEDLATKLALITSYTDKNLPIALQEDRNDAAKARFL